jgi:c-di-GMP-binding flagellar brake protein YcgR
MSIERRRFPRVSVESTNIQLVASRSKQAVVKIRRLIDFSMGGLQVEMEASEPAPRIGSLLDITLEWPGGQQRFDASVRHVSADGSGLARLGIEFDDPELVDKLLGGWFRRTEE